MEQFIETLTANPVYLIVAVVLAIIILFGAVKKLFKLVLLVLAIFILYIAYMVWTGKEVNMKSITKEIQTAGEKIQDMKKKVIDEAVDKMTE
ncbi:MAG: hypothetical protein GXO92_08295 [FCB group bacterium]|nr:hypothetical protein [FCB group bacterium]